MNTEWILTPQFFEIPERAIASATPPDAVENAHEIPDRSPASLAQLHRPIRDFVEAVARSGNRPASMAGDCCAAVPVLAGLRAAGIEPTLVWIDAHGDFNTPETSPSQFLGGMPLAMMVGRGPQWMCEAVGLQPFAEERVWLIDGRDLDELEREAVERSGLHQTDIEGLAELQIPGPVYVHLDVDVLSADEVKAFNYPVPGGPTVAVTVAGCRRFAAANDIVALSISGWTGRLDRDGRTGAGCREVIRALLGPQPAEPDLLESGPSR
ncbi:MAG: arginase family protein [Pseudomonadota bacterium]